MTKRADMLLSLSAQSVLLIVAIFASGCAGNREKQATSVKPTPGKKAETTENSSQTPIADTGGKTEGDDLGSGTGSETDVKINAELDNGIPSGPWDGKSFRGLGKWKVTPG